MDITPEIQDLLRKAIDYHGNVTQMAKSLGIAHSTILFWQSGKTKVISGRLWAQKLRPLLTPFATPDQMKSLFGGRSMAKSQAVDMIQRQGVSLRVVEMASLDDWDPAMEPLDRMAEALMIGQPLSGDGVWLRLSDSIASMPKGTLLQIEGEALKNGDTAIVIHNGTIPPILGTYLKTEEEILLDDGHRQINLRKESAKRLLKKVFKVNMALFP